MTARITIGSPGSVARRVHDALDAINASLPRETDAGIYYDNAYRRATAIEALIKDEKDPDALRILNRALESARYVGD